MFSKKGVLRNFAKFTGKHQFQSRPATLLKKRLWNKCFPVNFAKFLRTPFLTKHIRWLLLYSGLFIILHCKVRMNGCFWVKGTVMQIEKTLINDCLRVLKVSWYLFYKYHGNFTMQLFIILL